MGPGHKKKEYALIKVAVSLYNALLSIIDLKPNAVLTSFFTRLVWLAAGTPHRSPRRITCQF